MAPLDFCLVVSYSTTHWCLKLPFGMNQVVLNLNLNRDEELFQRTDLFKKARSTPQSEQER